MTPYDKLESKLSWVYLINLIFYIIPLFTVRFELWQYISMAAALLLFLFCYFWAYRCSRSAMYWPIAGIVVIAALITPVNPGSIAMFAYAGFFIGYACRLPRYVLLMALLIALLVLLYLLLDIKWNLFLVMGVPIVLGVSLLGRAEQAKLRHRLAESQSEDEIVQEGASYIERLQADPELRTKLGQRSREIAMEKFKKQILLN